MASRHTEYNDALAYIEQQELAGTLLVIRPEQKLQIGRAEKDPEKLRQVYELGRQAAVRRLEEIKHS